MGLLDKVHKLLIGTPADKVKQLILDKFQLSLKYSNEHQRHITLHVYICIV
jgi:hypothetical protein